MEERNRIIKLIFSVVLISFLLSTAVSMVSLHLMAAQNQRELSRVLAAQIYDTISIELGEPTVVARTMANDRFLVDMLERENTYSEDEAVNIVTDYLKGIQEGLGYEAAFIISDRTHRYYTFNGLNKIINPENSEYDRWYTDFLHSGRPYSLDVNNDELSQNAWTVFVNSRIEDRSGNLLGVGGVGFHMVSSRRLFEELEEKYSVKINLIDRNHIIQIDTDEEKIETEFTQALNLDIVGSNEYVYQRIGRDSFSVTKYVEILDWYLVVQSTGTNEMNSFINVILINLLLFLFVTVIFLIATRIVINRTEDLTTASFTDKTTQLLNRHAFEEAKTSLSAKPLNPDLVYVIADVNGLKTANDTLGHAAGDELIKGAADTLRNSFSPYGKVYRIGGDEFAVILTIDEKTFETVMEQFQKAVSSWHGEEVRELAISVGSASAREFPSETISELSRIADERMYNAKENYYVSTGRDRRRH